MFTESSIIHFRIIEHQCQSINFKEQNSFELTPKSSYICFGSNIFEQYNCKNILLKVKLKAYYYIILNTNYDLFIESICGLVEIFLFFF